MVHTRAKSLKYSIALWRRRWQRREVFEAEEREKAGRARGIGEERDEVGGWGAEMRNKIRYK